MILILFSYEDQFMASKTLNKIEKNIRCFVIFLEGLFALQVNTHFFTQLIFIDV